MKAETFYNSFVKSFSKLKLSWKSDFDRHWTKKLLGLLEEQGHKRGFKIYPSKKDRWNFPQYLVDQCWARETKNSQYYIDTAIEEEWSKKLEELEWDFYKLIDIKAYLKVFICAPKPIDSTKIMKEMERWIKLAKFRLKDEVYLVIELFKSQDDKTRIEGYRISNKGRTRVLKKSIC